MSESKSPNGQDAEARRQWLRRVVRELVAVEVADSNAEQYGPARRQIIEARVKVARRAFNIALEALL